MLGVDCVVVAGVLLVVTGVTVGVLAAADSVVGVLELCKKMLFLK